MPYNFNTTDGLTAVTVADGTVDTSTYSLALVGRNVSNYGLYFAQNTIRHLENFASSVAPTPSTKLEGQLWYDKGSEALRVWDGTVWKTTTGITVSSTAPASYLANGTAYFNTVDDKLRVYDGTSFKVAGYAGEVSSAYSSTPAIGSPSNYGTKIRNIYLKDSGGVPRSVLAITYVNDSANGSVNQGTTSTAFGKETIMAIFSDHSAFDVSSTDASDTELESISYYAELNGSGGIGTRIFPGLNLRGEYDTTSLALSERAYRADAAFVLNTGTYGADGSNIAAGNVVHVNNSYVPGSSGLTLGSSSSRFADTYTGALYLGNGSTGYLYTAGNVAIGNSTSRISTIHTTQFNVSGNVSFASGTATDAVSTNTANTLVLRDTNGSFAANVVTATATAARYADLAEIYASDAEYEPGTVVKLGGSAEITQTTHVEDMNVFGVISTDPAYLMNSEATGLPVALKGRVPVKVVGQVVKGERLVSSGTPGVAMALGFSEYDPRKVIGRSLENKTTEELGVVEAVIGVK